MPAKDGPVPTSREVWDARINAEYQSGNLTHHYRKVGIILLTFRGHGGKIYPSHKSIADRVMQLGGLRHCSVRTVERALKQLRDLGMLFWLPQHRRVGWRKLRSSNLYFLNVPTGPVKSGRGPVWPRCSTDRQAGRVQGKEEVYSVQRPVEVSLDDAAAARAALAQRRAVIERRVLMKG